MITKETRRLDKQDRALLDRLVEHIRRELPGAIAVYLFGTWGSPHQRKDSDIDLAVLPKTPLDAVACWELAQQLAAEAGKDVDLVNLRTASTVLRAQIIAGGERLHCTDENRCSEFEDFVFSDYARLNEERRGILEDIQRRGSVYGG